MHTPGHAVINLAILGGKRNRLSRADSLAIAAGAIAPDVPIVLFFFYEHYLRHESGRVIWGRLYFEQGWQACFDLLHSFPIAALGYLLASFLASRKASRLGRLFFASVFLHSVFDLPVHCEDAHAHFFPLS